MAIRYLTHDEKGPHWQVSGEDGKPDHRMMGAAWAQLHGGYRGHAPYSGPGKEEAIAALKRLYKSEGIPTPDESRASELGSRDPGPESRLLSEVRDGLVRIPLVYTNPPGTQFDYGGKRYSITEENLDELRANMAEREVPIDYEHLSAKADVIPPGWAKAAGWLAKPDTIDPFTEGRKLLWGWARFTPAMLAMIKDQEYRYCSVDAVFKGKSETGEDVGTLLKALAMTNRPFLKDLPPIEISDDDYQQLMGMGTRTDGKLAALTLSEAGARLIDSASAHIPGNISQNSSSAPAGGKENQMAKFTLKHTVASDGSHVHEVHGPDGKVGEIDDAHFCHYAEAARGLKPSDGGVQASELFFAELGRPEILRDAGNDVAKAAVEVKKLLERSGAPIKTEAALLSECIVADGAVDRQKLLGFVRAGELKADAPFLMSDAQARVEKALAKGLITPAQIKTGSPLRLALSDAASFKALIEDRPAVIPVGEIRGVGAAPGEKSPLEIAEMQLSEAISARMTAAKENHDQAEHFVVSTEEGRRMWETARKLRLEANAEKN